MSIINKLNNLLTLTHEEKKIVTLAALGGMFEFYDFVIYGIFSVYFASNFFPHSNNLISIMESYALFFMGYFVRPLGGLIFSHIGDEYGRKKVLLITITLMGFSSLGIGLLPTFAEINLAAPIILLILRLIQGLALGGELSTTYVFISESIFEKRNLSFGIVMCGVNAGLLLGTLINYGINYFFTDEQVSNYGWRIPFILGGFICLISYRIRKALHETPSFSKILQKTTFPLAYLFKYQLRELLIAIATIAIMPGLVVVTIVYMSTYLHEIVHVAVNKISVYMLIVMILNVLTIYLTGILAQKVKIHILLKTLLILSFFLIPVSYWLIYHSQILLIGLMILSMLEGMAAMIVPSLLTYFFPVEDRLTGVALAYNLSFTLFGGMAPILITTFINHGTNIFLTPAFYLLAIVIISSIGTWYANQYIKNKIYL